MNKIASADELEAELRKLLAYSQTESPSRKVLARDLVGLGIRVAGELPPEFLKNIKKKKKNDDSDDDKD
jgi:parvulin-like peptidyl-prolyl isomerase